jgi:hypothetical protein
VIEYTSGASNDISLGLSLSRRLPKESLSDDDKFLKFVKIPSQKLSEFWGTDMDNFYLNNAIHLYQEMLNTQKSLFPMLNSLGWGEQDIVIINRCLYWKK